MPEGGLQSNSTGLMNKLPPLNPSSGGITESQLLQLDKITPEDVKRLNCITEDYLCEPEANAYKIDFTKFKIRDIDSGRVLFEISKQDAPEDDFEHCDADDAAAAGDIADSSSSSAGGDVANGAGANGADSSAGRFVRYHFSPEFLKLKRVGATIEFTIGDKPVSQFRMVERHFFRNKLLKEFDFDFGFCIPNSTNSMEQIYDFPVLDNTTMKQMIENPWQTKSDSFYFVENKLIMHNKAEYSYNARI